MTTNSNLGTGEIDDAELEVLFARTLEGDLEDDDCWEAVHALRSRGGRPVFN